MSVRNIFIIGALAILLINCGGQSGSKKVGEQIEKSFPVIIQSIQPRDLKEYIRISGKLEGWIDIVMTSETSGKIIKLNKHLGDWVEKGEEIGSVDNLDYEIRLQQAEASLLATEVAYESAELQMQSSERLYRENKISQVEWSQARSNLKNALSSYNGAKAGLEQAKKALDNSRFVSPVSGYIADLPIKIGEMLTMGSPICSIVDSNKLIIKTGVGESSIKKLHKGQKVLISYSNINDDFIGTISGIGIRPLKNSAMYPVEIELPNKNNQLLPGMVVEARILSNIYGNVIYTSLNNIIQEYDNYFVFTITPDSTSVKKQVLLGEEVGENVIITSGVDFGEDLVIEGMENLEDGFKVNIRIPAVE